MSTISNNIKIGRMSLLSDIMCTRELREYQECSRLKTELKFIFKYQRTRKKKNVLLHATTHQKEQVEIKQLNTLSNTHLSFSHF